MRMALAVTCFLCATQVWAQAPAVPAQKTQQLSRLSQCENARAIGLCKDLRKDLDLFSKRPGKKIRFA